MNLVEDFDLLAIQLNIFLNKAELDYSSTKKVVKLAIKLIKKCGNKELTLKVFKLIEKSSHVIKVLEELGFGVFLNKS